MLHHFIARFTSTHKKHFNTAWSIKPDSAKLHVQQNMKQKTVTNQFLFTCINPSSGSFTKINLNSVIGICKKTLLYCTITVNTGECSSTGVSRSLLYVDSGQVGTRLRLDTGSCTTSWSQPDWFLIIIMVGSGSCSCVGGSFIISLLLSGSGPGLGTRLSLDTGSCNSWSRLVPHHHHGWGW